ncbi:MAG: DUF2911 domain-containing protein [Planctomycetes bacterium]|nr:DUF2911 domain-containing protein [Planctomycetota bacterium]
MRTIAIATLFVAAIASLAAVTTGTTPLPHPHFQKKIECRLADDLVITLTHLTVTFNREGEAKLPAGRSWHLANAHLETTGDVRIGGHDVKAGKYALKGRKTEAGGWELMLDDAGRFQAKIGANAKALATEFVATAPLREHLDIDIQPSGEKTSTTLWLEVWFDTRLARTKIELPAPADKK